MLLKIADRHAEAVLDVVRKGDKSVSSNFLLYGSSGFVGDAIAHLAVQSGLQPILAGRNADKLKT